jgi:predicted alpha/beta-hydrolase family hydrolase
MSTKGLVVQGTRDPFGDEAWGKRSLGKITPLVKWIDDGNHDFVPAARHKRSATACWDEVVTAAATFLTADSGLRPAR